MADLPLLLPDWPAPPNVRAAMTTRAGGVSAGPYASLNLGERVGDDPANVAENRRRLREALGLRQEPDWLKQVHGTTVVRLTRGPTNKIVPSPPDQGERVRVRGVVDSGMPLTPPLSPQKTWGEGEDVADASFTTEPGVVCAVQAADCLPVLFCDDAGMVVAAAHAGWRGLAAGVLEGTVRSLPVEPRTLMAWLGAAIGPQSFEVGAEVRAAFVNHDPQATKYFKPVIPAPDYRIRGQAAAGIRDRQALDARRSLPPSSFVGGGHDEEKTKQTGANGKYLADLYGLARQRLASVGVTRVFGSPAEVAGAEPGRGLCTFRDEGRFFSYRRDGQCGRMAALVWLDLKLSPLPPGEGQG